MTICTLAMTVVAVALFQSVYVDTGHAEDNTTSRINAMSYDADEGVIVGLSDGVKVGEKETFNVGYVSDMVFEPNKGTVWISSDHGLYQIDLKTGELISSVPNVPASSLTFGEKGELWVGTNGWGVVRVSPSGQPFDDQQQPCGVDHFCQWFNRLSEMPSNNIISTFTSSDGRVWFGTPKGAAVYHKDKKDKWELVGDLKNRWVYKFLEIDQYIFAGTDDGVFVKGPGEDKWHQLEETKGRMAWIMLGVGTDFYAGTMNGPLLRYNAEGLTWVLTKNQPLQNIFGDIGDKRITATVSPGVEDKYIIFGYSDGTMRAFDKPEWEDAFSKGESG